MCHGALRWKTRAKERSISGNKTNPETRFPVDHHREMKRIIQRASPDRAQCFNFLMCPCHRHSLESFLRQYPRQLPVWRHRLFISHILWILSLPAQSFRVISVRFLDEFVVHNEPNKTKKRAWITALKSQAGRRERVEKLQTAFANLNSVFLFLLSNTELVKVSAARA